MNSSLFNYHHIHIRIDEFKLILVLRQKLRVLLTEFWINITYDRFEICNIPQIISAPASDFFLNKLVFIIET